jgi:pilus assembly protein CpaF
MYLIEAIDRNNNVKQFPLSAGKHMIGAARGSAVRVPGAALDRHHAELEIEPGGKVYITDRSRSGKGVYLNGEQLRPGSCYEVRSNLYYALGEIRLAVRSQESAEAELKPTPKAKDAPLLDPLRAAVAETGVTRLAAVPGAADVSTQHVPEERLSNPDVVSFMIDVHDRTLEYLELHKRAKLHALSQEDLRTEAETAVRAVIKERPDPQLGISVEALVTPIVSEAVGLGPLEPLLADESITEIMCNGHDQIYVERAGKIEKITTRFSSADSLRSIIERIVAPLGRRIDEGVPMVDARLPDGSRVNAVIPPIALHGSTLTIRKFSKQRLTMQDLLEKQTLSEPMARLLTTAVRNRCNIIVSGGTGSGKTTTLNVLSNDIPERERIITIEDSAELQLNQQHVLSLESRPANVEGKGEVTIRDLVKNCLRMRPDRIVVGECRSGEALDMLQAMNTGHDGSLTTGHANSARDLLSRLEVMVLMSGVDLPVRAIREQIASAVDIILQQTRFSDGTRRITSIAAVDGMEGDVILLQKLFEFQQQGIDAEGRIQGRYVATGEIPAFFARLKDAGMEVDYDIFETGARAHSQEDSAWN